MELKTGISLFSGCGGDTLGMESCGIAVRAFTEIDPVVQETHRLNFPDGVLIGNGDMKKISDEEFLRFRDKIDIIFAGFPCQGFSNAGKKKQDDSRNALFHQFVRCVHLVQPKIIIGENVKGLLSRTNKEQRSYIEFIRDEFDKIGYTIAWKLYNCEKLVPQIRQRLLITGVRKNTGWNPIYFLPEIPENLPDKDLHSILKYSSIGETPLEDGDIDLSTIPEDAYVLATSPSEPEKELSMVHPYLLLKKEARGSIYPVPNGKVFPGGLLSFGKRISPIHAEIIDRSKPSKTIICTYDNQPRLFVPQKRHDGQPAIRTLNIDELKQIQGFPPDFQFLGNKKQIIHMIGNAVPPPLVSFVVRHIQSIISQSHTVASFTQYELFERICARFSDRMESSARMERVKGNTQALERHYNEIFSSILDEMDLVYTRAGSQQPVDYIVHHPADPVCDIPIELKRTSGSKIMCNDTYPKQDVYYIIIHEKRGVRWCKGIDLVRSDDPDKIIQYSTELDKLRKTFSKNGNIAMYARPNFSVCISHLYGEQSV